MCADTVIARFTIPTLALPAKGVDLLGEVPMEDRDTKDDLYEYMLGKIATAGQNGQFRTPGHRPAGDRGSGGRGRWDRLLGYADHVLG